MALVLKIAGTDRSASVNWRSLSKTEVLSKEVDQMQFVISKTSGTKYIPTAGQEVTLEEDAVKIFGGVIVEIKEYVEGGILLGYDIRCKDYSHYLDRKLARKSYENTEAGDIVADLITTYTSGFTTTNVPATSPIITTAKFNYEQITRAITKIADTIGWDWYVDYDKDIHFFNAETQTAPFDITDTNDKALWDTIDLNQSILQLRNVVFVRGGEYKSTILEANAIDTYEAQTGQNTFPLAYKYADIYVEKNGVVQTIGIDNIDNPASFNVLYNFQEKFITFTSALSAGDDIVVYGEAYIPVIAQARDTVSIAAYGEYQTVIIDKNITSIEEALDRARAELLKYASSAYEMTFKTRATGLRVGQRINVTLSTNRSITKTLKINRITGKAISGSAMEYTVALVSSGQITFQDILVELLERQKQQVEINPNEVIQSLELLLDSLAVTDSAPVVTTDSPPYTYAGGSNDANWGFATWS